MCFAELYLQGNLSVHQETIELYSGHFLSFSIIAIRAAFLTAEKTSNGAPQQCFGKALGNDGAIRLEVLFGNKNDFNITSSNIGAVLTLLPMYTAAVKARRY